MLTRNKLEEYEHVNIMMALKSVLTTQQAEFPPDIEGRSQRKKPYPASVIFYSSDISQIKNIFKRPLP